MNNREYKTKSGAHAAVPVPYEADDFSTYVTDFTSDSTDVASAILFVPALTAHFDRTRRTISQEDATALFEAAMNFFENEPDDLTDVQLFQLVHLSTVALLEMDDSPPTVFDQWSAAVIKWLLRNKDMRHNAHYAEKIAAFVALVEITFRPQVLLEVRSDVSCFAHLAKLIEATSDAKCRGIYIELAAQIARDPLDPFSPQARGAASAAESGSPAFPKKSVEPESQIAGRFIKDAVQAPSEDLCIHGLRAAAIFFDRFGGDGGLEPEVLGVGSEEEVEIPSEAQRKVGVGKVAVEKACKDVFAYLRSDQEERPVERLSEGIQLEVDRFDRIYLLHALPHVYPSGAENALQRTDKAVFRIAVIGLNWQKPWRDRTGGPGRWAEQYLRSQDKRKSDRLRDKDRKTRQFLDVNGARED